MLQTLNSPQPGLYEGRDDHGPGFDLGYFTAILRRRIFYFAVPFVVLLIIGFLIIAVQQPLYQAEGKILVESPQIPTNLVQPTVTAAATERIQVIQQRIMTRDNLFSIVKKFGLFSSEQRWMSSSELLDLMRERSQIELLDIDMMLAPTKDKNGKPIKAPPRPTNANNKNNSSAIAFTMSFEYENPEVAMKVANEFLTLILNEDVRVRTDRATETTQFLAREVKRLQGELDSINAQILAAKQQLSDTRSVLPDQLRDQREALTKMKTDLLQVASVYSDAHPRVTALKKRIAALEQQIAEAPKASPGSPQAPANTDIDALEQRGKTIEKNLDEASKKLIAARLGESMERDQQAEHLQVIEQPALPQKPSKPNMPKLFAIAFALAAIVGAGTAGLAEMLDKTIHGSRDLAGVVDGHLLVTVPYISTPGEISRRKRKLVTLWITLAGVLLSGLAIALYVGIEIDFAGVDLSWISSVRKIGLLVH